MSRPRIHAVTFLPAEFLKIMSAFFRKGDSRFSHDSNILRKYGTEDAGHLRYSPLMNA
jgi:hypothetical protein